MNYLIDRPSASSKTLKGGTLMFAHGAGAGMDSDFMQAMTVELTHLGITIVRFEFPYMQQRRDTGGRRPPNRTPILLNCWRQVYQQLSARDDLPRPLAIGGKSMGGRMATMIADELIDHEMLNDDIVADDLGLLKVVCFGYPFHPLQKPDTLRIEHLQEIQFELLVCQGTRDPMGKLDELNNIALSERIAFHWLKDGDHDLKPRVRSGFTQQQHIQSAAIVVATFLTRQ
jgi:predicted alpha/beta-hydrolase family hydrolase